MRIGHGYDVHRLIIGRKLILGGVEIPFSKGVLGHSDADVLCHAIGDALLGAACLGDIGTHFPDSDIKYAGISSLTLLNKVAHLLNKVGLGILSVDATLILQTPKVAQYILTMRENIAHSLGLDINQVSVKATTTEGLGFTGQGKGVAAHAVALLNDI